MDKLKPFIHHGLTLVPNGNNQAVGTCFLCDKPKHFYVSTKTGQWDCKSCGESGNTTTFLTTFYNSRFSSTPPAAYKSLTNLRKGIPASAFRSAGLAQDGSRWLFPFYNGSSKNLTDLRSWDGPPHKPISTPGCHAHPFLLPTLKDSPLTVPILLCEGEWDAIALFWLVARVKFPAVVLGIPGASTFPQPWLDHFKGRTVWLLYDNDVPGQKGMSKAARLLAPVVKELRCIHWPSNLPDKYDINDFVAEHLGKQQKGWDRLIKLLEAPGEKGSDSAIAPPGSTTPSFSLPEKRQGNGKPPTFSRLLSVFTKYVYLNKNMQTALSIMLATAISARIPGDPLWVFLVGPPGSGKSLIIQALRSSPWSRFESTVTRTSLMSGFLPESGEDMSLLKELDNRCLAIKDYTYLRSMPFTIQEETYGLLRDAYDGFVTHNYGNVGRREYECHFSLFAGVTSVIHGDTRATLGERFLKFEFLRSDHDPEKQIRAAIAPLWKRPHQDVSKRADFERDLREITADFLDRDPIRILPTIPHWAVDRIVPLAQLVGILRAESDLDFKGAPRYRPVAEIGTRLAKQIIRLGQCLALIHNKKVIDAATFRVMEQVAFDTAIGYSLDLITVLIRHPKGSTETDIQRLARLSPSTLHRRLTTLIEIGAVTRSRVSTPVKAGQPAYLYAATPHVLSLWKKARVSLK